MCTVTFVNTANGIVITSNRDEQVLRGAALQPEVVAFEGKKIIFPKDVKAGGTWFAADDEGNFAVLLNGAAEKHHHNPPYKISRGLILLDIIAQNLPFIAFGTIDLVGIEPFTIVLLQQSKLYQLRWNGWEKDIVELATTQNHIWSSATLYTKEIIAQRETWFREFLANNPRPTNEQLIDFHNYTHTDDTTNGLVINRDDLLKTISITQVYSANNIVNMLHIDLLNQQTYTNTLPIK